MVSKILPAPCRLRVLREESILDAPWFLLGWEAGTSTLDQGNSLGKGFQVLGEFFSAASFTSPCLAQVGPMTSFYT